MFPRYGKRHRRYKVKNPPRKMSYEKKLKIRSFISAGLLGVFIIMSFFNFEFGPIIKEWLYTTYSYTRWKDSFSPVFNKLGFYSEKTATIYARIFDMNTEKDEPGVSDTPKAEAKAPMLPEVQGPPKPEISHESWCMPHPGEVSSGFGERIHPVTGERSVHNGIDIAAMHGEEVHTVHSGTVEKTGYDDANGNYIVISHGDGITSVYIHLSVISVTEGQQVPAEEKIGEVGSTGMSTGPHLHFEIKENGVSVNPEKYIYPDKG